MRNRRYPIDLSTNMAVCDANYIRILKLLPCFSLDATRKVGLPSLGPLDSGCVVILKVEEAFRYTSTVSIRFIFSGSHARYFRPPALSMRLYHDASTAEVTSYQDHGRFHLNAQQGVSPGESPEFTADEKQQVNAFLAECLMLCIEHGMSHQLPQIPQKAVSPEQSVPSLG